MSRPPSGRRTTHSINHLSRPAAGLARVVDSLIKQFKQTSQLAGGNAAFIEDLYEQYLVDPAAVPAQWKSYFDGLQGREAGDVPHSAVMARVQAAARAGHGAGGVDEESARKQAARWPRER